MWEQNHSSNKKSKLPEAAKAQEERSSSDNWTYSKKEGTDSSLYDSGRTDSGFLSGANLLSDTIVSEEIRPSSPKPSSPDGDKTAHSRSYSRLDSGVDVGLSDQLSELCIESDNDDCMLSKVNIEPEPRPVRQSVRRPVEPESVRTHWQYYFQQDDDGDTQLHIAIIQGYSNGVFSLIQLVPEASYLDIKNDMRQTPLHLAVLTGQSRIVRRLVCAGADTRTVDHDGNTPLHLAVSAGDLPCVRALTEAVCTPEVLAAQLRYSAPHIRPPLPDMYNYEGLTCVHIAILGNHIEILKNLVWIGANINARECKRGMTCLHMACEAGNEDLTRLLLRELKANPHLQNYAGDTPYGVSHGHIGLIRILLSFGASPEVESDSDDEEDDFQMYGFKDLHVNGVVNATA